MTDYYPYRISSRSGELILIWRPGEEDAPDELLVDDRGRLLAFHDLKTLQDYCAHNGWELVMEEAAALDLDAVRRWAEHPHRGPVSAGLLLDAWNFFDDLSRSLKTGSPLPAPGSVHDNAYEKVFSGDPLAADVGRGAWTDEETEAMRELLRAGLDLWEQAVQETASG
ncbi:hypothetical protein [Streptomyces cadmiisoli]|uniref:hypothetical protein n=1 Tax=Streptomyces cadmiisoli TaxID=2184053 RepID=UPI00365FCCC9